MRVREIHSRELPASPERVGALLDGLGSAEDRLWPAERWPASPLLLDGPLAVGAACRQGVLPQFQLHQTVAEYEPGRRLVFRFAPGFGLDGTHGLEVLPMDAAGTRLEHTLDCRVEPKLLAVFPVVIRQHRALVEDLLDRAELVTTGRVAAPARWPRSVRVFNAIEEWVARRLGAL